jgi:hypothetical protein
MKKRWRWQHLEMFDFQKFPSTVHIFLPL